MPNLQRIRDRIRGIQKDTDSHNVKAICSLLEDLLFEDYFFGERETKIELIAQYLTRVRDV